MDGAPGRPLVVELDDVVAVLGSFPALAGASMRVRQGEIVLLQGPNGAGKTTLLRLCAGLLPLSRGGPPCSVTTWPSTAPQFAGRSGCSVIAMASTWT